MARSSLEAFSALWRAYGEGRLGESLHLVDPECELTLLDGVGPVRGHDGVRDCLAAGSARGRRCASSTTTSSRTTPAASSAAAVSPPRGRTAPASTGRW